MPHLKPFTRQAAAQGLMACALLTGMSAAWCHSSAHDMHSKHVIKEQKDWGIAGDAKAVQRTITLTMQDNMRFTPDSLRIKQGQTVRFVIKNAGQQMHELVIGTPAELDAHAALMLKFPTMEHSEPYMAHVAPGQRSALIWTFNRAGDFDFACLIAGHYQAGMVGKITVTPSP